MSIFLESIAGHQILKVLETKNKAFLWHNGPLKITNITKTNVEYKIFIKLFTLFSYTVFRILLYIQCTIFCVNYYLTWLIV
jgi:hypothetical protein